MEHGGSHSLTTRFSFEYRATKVITNIRALLINGRSFHKEPLVRYMAQAFNIDHRKLETSPTEQQLAIRNYEDTKKFFFSFAKDHFKML